MRELLCQDVQAGVKAKVLSLHFACLRGFLTVQAVKIHFAGKCCTKSGFVKKTPFHKALAWMSRTRKLISLIGIKISQAAFIFLGGDFVCWSSTGWECCWRRKTFGKLKVSERKWLEWMAWWIEAADQDVEEKARRICLLLRLALED